MNALDEQPDIRQSVCRDYRFGGGRESIEEIAGIFEPSRSREEQEHGCVVETQ